MAKVKFTNIAKYKGECYPAHTPFDVDDKDVASVVEQGAIVITPPEKVEEQEEVEEVLDKSIEDMKVNELKAYAKQHNIDIKGVEKKSEILAVIKEAECSEE